MSPLLTQPICLLSPEREEIGALVMWASGHYPVTGYAGEHPLPPPAVTITTPPSFPAPVHLLLLSVFLSLFSFPHTSAPWAMENPAADPHLQPVVSHHFLSIIHSVYPTVKYMYVCMYCKYTNMSLICIYISCSRLSELTKLIPTWLS